GSGGSGGGGPVAPPPPPPRVPTLEELIESARAGFNVNAGPIRARHIQSDNYVAQNYIFGDYAKQFGYINKRPQSNLKVDDIELPLVWATNDDDIKVIKSEVPWGPGNIAKGVKLIKNSPFIRWINGSSNIVKINNTKVINSAIAPRKGGETIVGHAFQKHGGRNPDIWGKVRGGPDEINQKGLKHLQEILDAPGEFTKIKNPKGIEFLEKKLPDGRGVRLNRDGTFKGFIDQ
ncbi:hypothetical protein CVD25_23055, partial [Bacillus canaveralius]